MTVEQLLTWAWAIMTDDKEHEESITGSAQQMCTVKEVHAEGMSFAIGALVLTIWPETMQGTDNQARRTHCEMQCFKCDKIGHLSSECTYQENA